MSKQEPAESPVSHAGGAKSQRGDPQSLVAADLREWIREHGLTLRVEVARADGSTPEPSVLEALAQRIDDRRACEVRQQNLSSLGELSASIVHETRNVMAGVLGLSQLATTQPANMAIIAQEIQRCTLLLSEFLSSASGQASDSQLVSVPELMEPVRLLTASRARVKRAQVVFEHLGSDSTVIVHAGDVRQIVLNLVLNALHAIDDGGKVSVESCVERSELLVRVRDDGPGVPPELRTRIFEPFFTTRLESGGSGLGLSTSRALAERRGGSLELSNASSGGACFVLRAPIGGRPAETRRASLVGRFGRGPT